MNNAWIGPVGLPNATPSARRSKERPAASPETAPPRRGFHEREVEGETPAVVALEQHGGRGSPRGDLRDLLSRNEPASLPVVEEHRLPGDVEPLLPTVLANRTALAPREDHAPRRCDQGGNQQAAYDDDDRQLCGAAPHTKGQQAGDDALQSKQCQPPGQRADPGRDEEEGILQGRISQEPSMATWQFPGRDGFSRSDAAAVSDAPLLGQRRCQPEVTSLPRAAGWDRSSRRASRDRRRGRLAARNEPG